MFDILLAQAITVTPTMAQLVGERVGIFWCQQLERGVSNYAQLTVATSQSPDIIIERSPELSGEWRINEPELYRRYIKGISETVYSVCPVRWEKFMKENHR